MRISNICFYNGIDVEIDKKMAFDFFRRSAVRGYADAEFTVGLFYLNGEKDVVETNTTAAAQWFAKAAEQVHPKAELYLGICYRKGVGVKREGRNGDRETDTCLKIGGSAAGELTAKIGPTVLMVAQGGD